LLPFIVAPQKPVAYASGVREIAILGATEMEVSVDLNRRRVVDVDPAFGDGIELPLWVVSPPRPAGGRDTPTCWQQHD
jgi:hypothetical protein